MLRSFRYVLLSALVLASSVVFFVGDHNAQTGIPGKARRLIFAPFYSVHRGVDASITLNNTTRDPLTVKPTLFSLDGAGASIPPVSLGPHETKRVSLADWVSMAGEGYQMGSLSLEFESVAFGLGSQIALVDGRKSLVTDVPLKSRWEYESNRLEAVWWIPNRDARMAVAVSNTTDGLREVSFKVTDQRGDEIRTIPVPLQPHQTRIVNLQDVIVRHAGEAGGITVIHDGAPGAVMAHGFLTAEAAGFSLNLGFNDPSSNAASKLDGAGVLVGQQSDGGRYSGHLILRNPSVEPVVVTGTLQSDGSERALGQVRLEAGEARMLTLPYDALPVPPGPASIRISHTGAPGAIAAQWFSVDETGSLVVETPLRSPAASTRGSGNNPWSLEDDTSAIMYVKNIGNEVGTFIGTIDYDGLQYSLEMPMLQAGETVAFDIRKIRDQQTPDAFGSRLPLDLMRGQIRWNWLHGGQLIGRLNVMSRSKGIASNMSCSSCSCFPTGAQINLDPSAPVKNAGENFQETVVATYFGCAAPSICILPASSFAWTSSPSSVATVSSGSVQCVTAGDASITASKWEDINSAGPPTTPGEDVPPECSPTQIFLQGSSLLAVKPKIDSLTPARGLIGTTTSVTIQGNGFTSGATVNAGTGITATVNSASATQIQASFNVSTSTPAGDHSVTVTISGKQSNAVMFYVQVPTRFREISVMTTPISVDGCSLGTSGHYSDVTYEVLDQGGQPVQKAGMIPQEHVTINGVQTFPGFKPFATPQSTDSLGMLLDRPVGTCFGPPVPMGNPCVDVVQTFNIRVSTGSGEVIYAISTVTTGRDCSLGQRLSVSQGGVYVFGTVN